MGDKEEIERINGLIIMICHNKDNDNIKEVKVMEVKDGLDIQFPDFSSLIQVKKEDIIKNISDKGMVYYTATQNYDEVVLGAEVYPVPTQNPKFITTKPNDTTRDNLGNLPEYDDCNE